MRRRRSALDFDPRTPPMERQQVEQLLDFATRDWPTDWRGNFGGETTSAERGADFVTPYLYVHRVRDCEPGVHRWDKSSRRLVQLHCGNVERVAAYLSLEQALAGNACFAVSMIADLTVASRVFGNRGYRYVHFEAGAIGQRLYVGAEALGWSATGIGAFYDDDVHRYLGFLEEGEAPVACSGDFRIRRRAPFWPPASPEERRGGLAAQGPAHPSATSALPLRSRSSYSRSAARGLNVLLAQCDGSDHKFTVHLFDHCVVRRVAPGILLRTPFLDHETNR